MDGKDLIKIREGSAEIYFYKSDENTVPSKSMNVFYNKRMSLNRDISNLAINAYSELYEQKDLIIVDLMAASGISAIRMLIECNNIKKMYINDLNSVAIDLIQNNLALNKLENSETRIKVTRKDANLLLLELAHHECTESHEENFPPNVISIDPFGTPNLYIDGAFKAIRKRNGLMCVTATDTAVLFGVRPKACIRKYMSKPLYNEYSKEIGARILVHFISRIANVNKMGIIPLLTFYSGHFLRVFALTFKSKDKISQFFENYGYIEHCKVCGYRKAFNSNVLELSKECPNCSKEGKMDYAGPLWVNEIHDFNFVERIQALNKNINYPGFLKLEKMLSFILSEIGMPVSYYNIHKMCQSLKLNFVPKMDDIISKIKESGFRATRTNFDFTSIKTDINLEELKKLFLELKKELK